MTLRLGDTLIAGSGANKDLSNLTSQGKNIANWSSNVTNCITEIPQDIKLELNNGTLTLKVGSKVTYPDGTQITISTDETIPTHSADGEYVCVRHKVSGEYSFLKSLCYSGTTAPTGFVGNAVWFDTTNNIIKNSVDSGATWENSWSLPVGIVTQASGAYTSIDQVFNGFGYIGSTVFALPGVKGLIPNGRNEDGTLKNIESTLTKVHTYWLNPAWGTNPSGHKFYLRVFDEVQGGFAGDVQPDTRVIYSKGIPSNTYAGVYYDTEENKWFWVNNGEISAQDIMFIGASFTANITASTFTVAGNFTPKTAFHALDYNDSSTISGWSMPSSRYIDLTLGASGATYTAPANGYYVLSKKSGAANQVIGLINNNNSVHIASFSAAGNEELSLYILASKGDSVGAYYTASGAVQIFRFVYTNGEQ